VLSLQWVYCEPVALSLNAFVSGQHTLFSVGLQGTTVVAASGDSGAYGCGSQPNTAPYATPGVMPPPAIRWPCRRRHQPDLDPGGTSPLPRSGLVGSAAELPICKSSAVHGWAAAAV